MGSGLIFAGIGKGISDAGAAYGNAMGKAAELEWRQQEEERSFQRKLDLEEKRAETLKQRVISEIQAVNAKADEIGKARDASQLEAGTAKIAGVASQVKGDSPAMSQDEIKQLIKENPQYVETYRKAGLIAGAATPNQQRLQSAEDKVQAALSIGAHSSVIETFEKSKKSVLDEIKEENREKRDQQRHEESMAQQDRLGKQFETTSRIAQQNADANTTRANKPPSTGNRTDPNNKPTTGIDLERTAKAAKQALALELGVPDKEVSEKVAQLKKKGPLSSDVQTRLDAYNSALSNWQNYKSNQPSANRNTSDNPSSRPPIDSFRR